MLRAAVPDSLLVSEVALDTLVQSPFGSAPSSPARNFDRLRASFFGLGAGLAFLAQILKLLIRKMLDTDERISCGADADQFVQLDLDGGAVAVLGILNEENHEKCYDRGAGVDD